MPVTKWNQNKENNYKNLRYIKTIEIKYELICKVQPYSQGYS